MQTDQSRTTITLADGAGHTFTVANGRGFAMAAAVRVRGDYEAAQIRVLAKRSENAAQTRRLLALAAIYDGGSRTEAARIGGVGVQTVRDWVLAFNAEGSGTWSAPTVIGAVLPDATR
jgi:Winged helix-turn helix